MSPETLHGPGLLFVRSRISPSSKEILSETTFLKWYDDEHVPEVLSKSEIKDGFRYVDIHKSSCMGDASNDKPYLACYPMHDLAYTLSSGFKNINVKSDILPGTGIIYDLADLDTSFLGFISATPKQGCADTAIAQASYIMTSGIRPETEPGQDKVLAFYTQQTELLSQIPLYMRTLHFKLLYARTNAQSRAFKGLPTTNEPLPEPSTWLAVHEFSGLPEEDVVQSLQRSVERGVDGFGKTESEVLVWRLDRVHGRGRFLDEEE